MKFENIKKCKAPKFIPNLGEISSYYNARKNVPLITNISRLIGIIRIYFETLLYYKDNSPRKFIVNIKGRLYEAKINAHNEAGQPISLDLEDISDQLIKDVIYDLTKIINLEIFDQAIQLLNSILLTTKISVKQKISIINGENTALENRWYTLVRQLPEKLALDTILIRKDIIFQILKSPQKHFPDLTNIDQNISVLHNAYELYIKTLLRVHISNNHYIDVITALYNELEDIKKNSQYEYINVKRLVTFLLTQLVLNNNLFQIERKNKIREIIEEYGDYIDKDKSKIIYDGLDFNPANFELDKVGIELVEPDFLKEDLDSIKTVISFVLPFQIEVGFTSYELEDNTKIEFIKINNLFEDPIFSFLDSFEININGMPLTFFADSIGNLERSLKINLIVNEFYHPDFELIGDKVIPKSVDKEEAKRGGRYFPHKDLIIDKLWTLHNQKGFPFEIDIKNINSNLISNYLVSYFDKDHKLIHHKLFTITNFDSYFKAKNKFINNLNKLYFEEDPTNIRDFIFETQINSGKALLDFCYRLIEITLKKSVEYGGLYKAFWTEKDGTNVPIPETSAQPIIYNYIRFIAEIKGISLSRESIAADGSLDFHFSYTKNDVLMNVCVELKNAHHQKLEHGVTTQLPLYIKDIGNREGIFLILWYKSEEFNKPDHFNEIKDIEEYLLNLIPKKYRIKPLIIDCTKKISPSKKAANKRLK
jgi:hypothetical protein